MEKPRRCAQCGGVLPAPHASGGRPPTYCNPACRRAAEYELRRIQSTLTRLEKVELDERLDIRSVRPYGVSRPAFLKSIQTERARQETRLRVLLAGMGENQSD